MKKFLSAILSFAMIFALSISMEPNLHTGNLPLIKNPKVA